ncbi:M15 family metallopeptidase [Nocardioides pocheonensis]|uniref:D-alanyl-D-alanine carboxypeptidase-like core domain-containing protein n=1 Tax=Nocardioides pocheonensis TaxID=661485 RepID=A0A3N0GMN7_9ACTN|nr:M15 family metallopeptidase [Nocardioides pocheonensis]RNM13717.1 hypothetical protein EFL26_12095 [Nocardioides pocheonensis]
MSSITPSRATARRARSAVAVLVVLAAVVLGGLVRGGSVIPSAKTITAVTAAPVVHRLGSPTASRHGRIGVGDGFVPDGTTVFDAVPAVARLDPALLAALRRAGRDAAAEHVALDVNSGWRSAAYQTHLLDEPIRKYGSREEAARWVATPARSAHVSGDAVDLGHDAAAWLAEHGARYGLCRVYANEPWHFELRPDAVHDGCPETYADPTHDPRMYR